MITTTDAPLPGSVFTPTRVHGIEERFVAASMRPDVPPCEYVEATFDDDLALIDARPVLRRRRSDRHRRRQNRYPPKLHVIPPDIAISSH